MQKEIIVNSTPYEVRIAILEDKELVELLIERAETKRIVGDIYKGVVTAVLPGIQAAFVDIGAEKAAFLHVSDLVDPNEDEDEPTDRRRGNANGRPLPAIQDVLQKGEEILVQVTKEPIATKGPRITTQISLPGRFAVIMPNADHTGVSRKIEDRNERQRLKGLVERLKPADCGLIVRTVGEGVEERALENDVAHLESQWKRIQEKAAPAPAPSMIHQDVGLVIGLVRDVFNDDVDQLVLDNRKAFDQLTDYLRDFAPDMLNRIKLYDDPMPVFDKYGIENEIDKTLDRKVWLKKGGYIIIEQTEALVSVDVNTGRFTGKKNQEETIFKTNVLAAREIARQLRLRDIGGIIVIDFIDMESEANKKKVLAELRSILKRDRAKSKAFQVSDLGLIEMSRQRVRPSLYHFMSDECSYCESTGHVLSLDSVANRIQRMVRRVGHYTRARELRLLANPRLTLFLREERSDRLGELMDLTGVRIDLVDDPRLHREDFRLLSVDSGEDLMRRIGSLRGSRTEAQPTTSSSSTPRSSSRNRSSTSSTPRRRGGRGRSRRGGNGGEGNVVQDVSGDGRGGRRGSGRRDSSARTQSGRGGGTNLRDGRADRGSREGRDSGVTPAARETSNAPDAADGRESRDVRDGRDGRRRRRGSRGRGRRGRPILEDNPNLSSAVKPSTTSPASTSDD